MINPATAEADGAGASTAEPPSFTPATERSPATRGINGSNFKIRGDLITAATAELPERQREALRWLAGHCRDRNLDHKVVATRLLKPDGQPYSGDSVYHALTGGRTEEQLENIVSTIERYRRAQEKIEEGRTNLARAAYVHTAVGKRIWKICRRALLRRRVCFIWGETQTGKTTCLEEYQRKHNHGETHMMRCPARGRFKTFLRLLAISLGVPIAKASEADLRELIIAAVDDHMLLIVDEMHEPFGPNGDAQLGVDIVNFLREVYDRKKCGLVLCGTPIFKEAILHGPFRRNLAQIWKRGLIPLQLPPVPGTADLVLFARQFGLEAAPDEEIGVRVTFTDDDGAEQKTSLQKNILALQTEVVAKEGLGRWITILEEASDLAREKRRPVTWGLVLHAWHSFEQDASFLPATVKEAGAA